MADAFARRLRRAAATAPSRQSDAFGTPREGGPLMGRENDRALSEPWTSATGVESSADRGRWQSFQNKLGCTI